MSQLAIEKNGITGIHTKMLVLENQSYCPFISLSLRSTPKQITWVNILAVLNKQLPLIDETISYIKISVIRLVMYELQLLTVTVTLPLPVIICILAVYTAVEQEPV
ncbi:MAG: hypothetical protein EZS28_000265 [Streblomastix strix]|uniref:Uncharacterized protein n=1 Tax=Streblomastix strix TaxID=222440 RepID=A0A5J4XAS0_9EUKA|nr:MAG: hypothetical protein EZS28_000265 [Streblomastix strix]